MKGDRIRESATPLTDDSRPLPKPGERITAAIYIDDDVALFYSLNHEVEEALRTFIAEGRAGEPGAPGAPGEAGERPSGAPAADPATGRSRREPDEGSGRPDEGMDMWAA